MEQNDYFQLLYDGKLQEAKQLRISTIPDKLIKFIWLDENEKDEKKFKSLENNEIWFSNKKILNDPFEFKGINLDCKKLREDGYQQKVISQTFIISICILFKIFSCSFKTLINRSMWLNPLSNVIGVWGLYTEKNGELILTTEVPENLALFIPFTILLLWTYRERIIGEEVRLTRVLWQSTKIVFIFSFTIEMLQLFLRLGTWQLSDLFYNTLGGFIGGLVYWIGYRIKHRK